MATNAPNPVAVAKPQSRQSIVAQPDQQPSHTYIMTGKGLAEAVVEVAVSYPAPTVVLALYFIFIVTRIIGWLDFFGWNNLLLIAAMSCLALPALPADKKLPLAAVVVGALLLRSMHHIVSSEQAGLNGLLIFPPSDAAVPEWMLPVYDKPAWEYSMGLLLQMGVQNILVYSSNQVLVHEQVGTGEKFGVTVWYGETSAGKFPMGFLDRTTNAMVAVRAGTVLFSQEANLTLDGLKGARVFSVNYAGDASKQFVIERTSKGDAIIDPPHNSASKVVIPAIFMFDGQVRLSVWKALTGKIPWSELARMYQRDGQLEIQKLSDAVFTDMTCPKSTLLAANHVHDTLSSNGTVPTLESIAVKHGWIKGPSKWTWRGGLLARFKGAVRGLSTRWLLSPNRLW